MIIGLGFSFIELAMGYNGQNATHVVTICLYAVSAVTSQAPLEITYILVTCAAQVKDAVAALDAALKH